MIINVLLFASNVLKFEIKCSKKPKKPSYWNESEGFKIYDVSKN